MLQKWAARDLTEANAIIGGQLGKTGPAAGNSGACFRQPRKVGRNWQYAAVTSVGAEDKLWEKELPEQALQQFLDNFLKTKKIKKVKYAQRKQKKTPVKSCKTLYVKVNQLVTPLGVNMHE